MKGRSAVATLTLGLFSVGTVWPLGYVSTQSPCAVADLLVEAGRLGPAAELLSSLLAEDPAPACAGGRLETIAAKRAAAQAKQEIGQAHERLGDLQAATGAYAHAADVDPSLDAAVNALVSLASDDKEGLPPCSAADALLETRQLGAATGVLLALLERDPDCVCARQGLERAVLEKTAALKTYELGASLHASDPTAAARRYVEAAQADRSLDAATKALLSLDSPPARRGEAVSVKLARFGLDKDVVLPKLATEVEAGLKLEGVQATLADQRLAKWRGFLLDVGPWVRTGGEILLTLALLALTLFRWLLRRIVKPTLEIKELNASALDKTIGADLAVLVADQLQRFGRSTSEDRLDQVTGEISAEALPEEVATGLPIATGWLAAFPSLLKWLWPARSIVVTGSLHADSGHGPGATLLVESDNRLVATETFWLQDLEPAGAAAGAGDHYRLSHWMACWLLFHVPRKGFRQKPPRIVGTTDWKSYSWFRKGLSAEAARDSEGAMRCFRAAMDQDPSITGAKVNLGRWLARSQDRADQLVAKQLFERAKRQTRDGDAVHYAASYSLAVAHYHLGDVAAALDEARELIQLIEGSRPWTGRELRRYRQQIEPGARGLVAGLQLVAGTDAEKADAIEHLETYLTLSNVSAAAELSPRARYNIACALSLWAEAGDCDEATTKRISDVGNELLVSALRSDWTLLAGFRAGDHTLAFLVKSHQAEIETLLAELTESPSTGDETPPLQRIGSIGRHAVVLESLSIETGDALLRRLLTDRSRKRLAREAGVTLATVESWARQLDLIELTDLELEDLTLLDSIGLTTREELRSVADPQKLVDRLTDAAVTQDGAAPPDAGRVAVWLLEAQEPPVIS